MRIKSLFFTLLWCGNALFIAGAAAQTQRALDTPRMQRDLEIMEMVLDRLLNESSAPALRLASPSARGVYLPEFGVLFQVPQTLSAFSYYEFHTQSDENERPRNPARATAFGRGLSSSLPAKISREDFAGELMDFFSRYADAIGQLRGEDRIAVYRGGGPELSVFFNISGSGSNVMQASHQEQLAWVRKSDLDALQAGKLNEENFKSRVSSTPPPPEKMAENQKSKNEFNVLAGIFDVALGAPRGTANGIYIDDYGAVFFTRADFHSSFPRQAWRWNPPSSQVATGEGQEGASAQALEDYLRAVERASREREKNWQGEYEKFKEKVMETIADYGHTLGSLRSNERLVVITDLPGAPEKKPRQLVCAVAQQQMQHYHDRKISREQLRKAMVFYEN